MFFFIIPKGKYKLDYQKKKVSRFRLLQTGNCLNTIARNQLLRNPLLL